jgi:hypothetical protein
MRGAPIWGAQGWHEDDWESVQIRIGPGGRGVDARASSHHGYNGAGGMKNWTSDAGWTSQPGWTPYRGRSWVSGGSHAGHVSEGDPLIRIDTRELRGAARRRAAALNRLARKLGNGSRPSRWTPPSRLRLVPIEPLRGDCSDHGFAVSPPWCKRVYEDPEYQGTN